ncbi:hypothetical protein [Flavobacterium sedimenticola]|uniref:Uncharacterized protein n=1 Tax=Flavobacterium sedimenticola TaxID=3043286 RepID=A0ABT6XP54_9FLAO|nr:hypothetical protein [Flavobacterium sedimenticola]MDI9256866.1 hypothetical protein [Flavobacterium sedimenticola]
MKVLTITFFLLTLLSFNSRQDLENDKYLNYLTAARNAGSTYSFNLVIKYKNLNSGIVREICVESDQLIYAICDENNLQFPENSDKIDSIVVSKKDRYFEFKDTAAINRLTFEEYSIEEFEEFNRKVDFKKVVKEIKQKKKVNPTGNPKAHQMYAHALFNLGILTGQNDCMGGWTLDYVDRNNPY